MSIAIRSVIRGTAFAIDSADVARPCELVLTFAVQRPWSAGPSIEVCGTAECDGVLALTTLHGHLRVRSLLRPSALLDLRLGTAEPHLHVQARWAPSPLHPLTSFTRLLGTLSDATGATIALLKLHFDTRRDLADLLSSIHRASRPAAGSSS